MSRAVQPLPSVGMTPLAYLPFPLANPGSFPPNLKSNLSSLKDDEERKELDYWYSKKTENVDKVYGVEKIFRRTKVDEKALSKLDFFVF